MKIHWKTKKMFAKRIRWIALARLLFPSNQNNRKPYLDKKKSLQVSILLYFFFICVIKNSFWHRFGNCWNVFHRILLMGIFWHIKLIKHSTSHLKSMNKWWALQAQFMHVLNWLRFFRMSLKSWNPGIKNQIE